MNATDHVAAAARAAARGERYDIDALEGALDETGMTMADFEKAVATAQQRAAWMTAFEKLAVAAGKVAKAEAAAAAEKARFEAARTAFIERATAIDAELTTYRVVRDRGQEARNQLLDPRNVPGTIGQRYRDAVEAAAVAEQELAAARSAVREHVEKVKYEERWIQQLLGEEAATVQPAKILMRGEERAPPGYTLRLQDHRNALARAQRRQAESQSQLDAAEDRAAAAQRVVEQLVPEVLKA